MRGWHLFNLHGSDILVELLELRVGQLFRRGVAILHLLRRGENFAAWR